MNDSKYPDSAGCQGVRELVPWYPTGTLDPKEKGLVETHTATCEACADLLVLANRVRRSVAAGIGIHLEPDTLVAYVEEPDSLSPELLARTERHLNTCQTCRHECEMLQAVEAARTGSRLRQVWEALTGSILKPVPAALYLTAAILLVGINFLPAVRQDSQPHVGPVLLLYDTLSEVRGASSGEIPLPVFERGRERVVILEFTNLLEPPAPDTRFDVTITETGTGATVWQTRVLGELFADNYTLALTIEGAALAPGEHAITVFGPERQPVFQAEFEVH